MVIASEHAALWATAGATIATTVVLLGSAIFALWQLREATRTRTAQMVVEMTERWGETELRAARRAMAMLLSEDVAALIQRMYDHTASPEDSDTYYRIIPLAAFIEVIGIVVGPRVEALTIAQVDDLWGGAILGYWDKWEAAVEIMETQPNAERAYQNFRRLAQDIRAYRHGAPPPGPGAYYGVMAPPPR